MAPSPYIESLNPFPPSQVPPPLSDSAAGARPILLIDDDEDAHFFLHRSLKKIGVEMTVEVLLGGDAALRYLTRCVNREVPCPAFVFLDIKMPTVTGFDVLAWMHEQNLTKRIPVAMLSSSDDPRDVSRAMQLGANCYLTKPPDDETLGEIVRSALKGAADPLAPEAHAIVATAPVVLVVDDSKFARGVARRLVESLGYAAVEAENAEAALAFCRSAPPMLVLLDLTMVGMDGFHVMTRLRAMRSNLRIIVVSASTDVADKAASLSGGALGYVTKPLTKAELEPAILRAMSTPQWL